MSNLLNIAVWYAFPPIPIRTMDYAAYIEDEVENGASYCWAETKAEALKALGEKIVERVDDRIHDLMTEGVISGELAEECWATLDGLEWLRAETEVKK